MLHIGAKPQWKTTFLSIRISWPVDRVNSWRFTIFQRTCVIYSVNPCIEPLWLQNYPNLSSTWHQKHEIICFFRAGNKLKCQGIKGLTGPQRWLFGELWRSNHPQTGSQSISPCMMPELWAGVKTEQWVEEDTLLLSRISGLKWCSGCWRQRKTGYTGNYKSCQRCA